jgi:ribosomal protein L29
MKKQEKENLAKKTVAELQSELGKMKKALLEAKIKHARGQLKNTSLLSRLRDDIAVVKTLIREKLLMEGKANE